MRSSAAGRPGAAVSTLTPILGFPPLIGLPVHPPAFVFLTKALRRPKACLLGEPGNKKPHASQKKACMGHPGHNRCWTGWLVDVVGRQDQTVRPHDELCGLPSVDGLTAKLGAIEQAL